MGTHLFRPHVADLAGGRDLLLEAARGLARCFAEEADSIRASSLEKVDHLGLSEDAALHLRIAISALCDLKAHDWEVEVIDGDVHVGPPDRTELNPQDHKQHVRDSLLVERDAQLAEPATRRFVTGMERQQKHGTAFRSIYSLLRDGAELASDLERVRKIPRGRQRTEAMRRVIDPYVQVVERGTYCRHTGLDLQDIWRYFRHTWATPYRSVPGRQISFLVRDRAAPNHPVIGIGSLASSVVQQKQRDKWIGWHPETFMESLEADQYRGWSTWLRDRLQELLADVYAEDFFSEGVLTRADFAHPSSDAIERLQEIAEKSRAAHRLYRQEDRHKAARNSGELDWRAQAETYLFRAKRAGRLAALLQARRDLADAGFTKNSPKRLRKAAGTQKGRRGIRTVLRFVKAAHVGIDMMDISVCGAIDPYRAILGGKLVALLLASPDVAKAYAERYRDSSSIIASSMAGKSVKREPRLVLLMTTSLYSVASAQYNRLAVRPEQHEGEGTLEYRNLERTVGWGSYHFSKTTVDAMEILLAREDRGREVNSIFGEGVNPKLRKIRGGLEAVGLSSDQLLKHGSKRIVYGVPLASNFRDILIGRARRPRYIVPQSETGTSALIDYWYERWLAKRIERDDVLESVASHSAAHPIEHGARVQLPALDDTDGVLLFE